MDPIIMQKNWTTSQDNFAYPEYLYNNVANTYYAVNSAEDFSRSLAYYTGQNKADGCTYSFKVYGNK